MSLQQWHDAGSRYWHRGHAIFVQRGGDPGAPPLLLIHGFPTASSDWAAIWPSLVARYRVVALDMIGLGFSAKPADHGYSIADQADLIEGFLQQEGVRETHVLAHDLGDTVAQELLARSREPGDRPRFLSVSLLNGGLFPETHRAVLMQKVLLSPVGRWVARLSSRPSLASNMRRVFGPHTQPDEALIDDFWTLMEHNQGRAVLHKLIRYIAERRQHRARWVSALAHAVVPLQLINGSADPVSGAHMVARNPK
jgi:pimeloyl-ACP methyl ester carboxylesterase